MSYKVLVCGGRDYFNVYEMRRQLLPLNPTLIITGDATGADAMARLLAKEETIPLLVFYANWQDEGRSAGPRRNQRMLDEGEPDVVLAFPGGRGTADMVKRAQQARVPVITVPARLS